MALQSRLFQGDAALEACLIKDSAHLVRVIPLRAKLSEKFYPGMVSAMHLEANARNIHACLS